MGNLNQAILEAEKVAGRVMIDTTGYFKKSAVHRKVTWKNGLPTVRIDGFVLPIVSVKNLTDVFPNIKSDRPIYLFKPIDRELIHTIRY